MISIHDTPNPNALKFVVGANWINFVWECVDQKDADKSILAKRLWDLGSISYMMFGYDFVSVIKKNDAEWKDLETQIVEIIDDFIKQDIGLFENAEKNDSNFEKIDQEIAQQEREFSKLEMQIIQTLDEKVQPVVQMHGGVVKFIKFDEGVVVLDLQGACRGCPSSSITLKNGIQNLLCYYFPEVMEVVSL